MSPVSCQRCEKLLPHDAAYCPNCGTRASDASATFVLGSPGNDTGTELFGKPEPEAALSWRPTVVGLAALFAIVAVVIAVNGTGSDVAGAPTPTPVPSPPAASAVSSAVPWVTSAVPWVQAGSDAEEYLTVLTDLARDFDLRGTIIFADANQATRLDLQTGAVAQIPLDGRDYRLGARSGIISGNQGRTIVGHRWDAPSVPIEITAGYADFVGTTWVDPNGWELVPFTASGELSIAAVWDTPSEDSPNVPTKTHDAGFLEGPFEIGAPHPQRWTWDGGAQPLRWDEILAADNGRLLVRGCDAPGECAHLVVDNQDDVIVTVDESFTPQELADPHVVLSSGTAALWTDAGVGEDVPKVAAIIDLASGARTRLPNLDHYLHEDASIWLYDGFWIDDTLIVLAYLSEHEDTYVFVDRNGRAVARLSLPPQSSHLGALRYFAPDDQPRPSR